MKIALSKDENWGKCFLVGLFVPCETQIHSLSSIFANDCEEESDTFLSLPRAKLGQNIGHKASKRDFANTSSGTGSESRV